MIVALMALWGRLSNWPWEIYHLNCGFSNGSPARRLQICMYVSSARFWISCVPCGHITDDIIVPTGCQYVHWFCERNVPFHLFVSGRTSLQAETKGQLCSKRPLDCSGSCKVRIASSYCLKYATCELPSPTLHKRKAIQTTLHIMPVNGNSSFRILYPLGKCEEGSL